MTKITKEDVIKVIKESSWFYWDKEAYIKIDELITKLGLKEFNEVKDEEKGKNI